MAKTRTVKIPSNEKQPIRIKTEENGVTVGKIILSYNSSEKVLTVSISKMYDLVKIGVEYEK